MKNVLLLFFTVLLPSFLSAQENSFIVSGQVENLESGTIRIYYKDSTGKLIQDSAIVKNGHFTYSRTIEQMEMLNFYPPNERVMKKTDNGFYPAKSSQFQFIVFPGANVKFTGRISDFVDAYPSGDPANDDLAKLNRSIYPLMNKSVNLQLQIDKKIITNTAEIEKTKEKMAKLDNEVNQIKKTFVKEHPSSFAAAWLLGDMMLRNQITNEEAFHLYDKMDQQRLSVNPFFIDVVKRIEGLRATAIGKPAPSIQSTHTYTGKSFDLASLQGKYVVLDFWGTWCGPCTAGMPRMKEYLDKYKDQLEIVGVAQESDDGTRWRAFLDQNPDYRWYQVLSRPDENYILKYSVAGFPTKIIIDPQGNIVARYVGEDDAIYHKLDSLLGDRSPAEWKAMIAENPDSLRYHQQYIRTFMKSKGSTWANQDSVLALIVPQYEKWMRQFPQSSSIPFAIGHALAGAESPEAKPYLLEAVKRNPKLAEAWMDLAIDAERWGDGEAARKYMGNAATAEPSSPDYAFYHAMDFEQVDPAKWRSMLYALAKRFPDHERGAQGLYWLAVRSRDPAEKLKVFEQLKQLYPPDKFRWSSSGMSGLYELYLKQDPQKAVALAGSMDGDNWGKLDTIAQNVAEANRLMAQKQYQQAADLLRHTQLPRYPDLSGIIALAMAKADNGAGNIQGAYDNLLTLIAKEPTQELYNAATQYGKLLDKNEQQVRNDIWAIREKAVRPAPAFDLGLYTSDVNLSLADLKGKVVLLTFWFPGCGPCRGEFPHFENVMDKFDKKDVAYIAINIIPQQDPYVLPFMKGTGYSFIPLRSPSGWAEEVYKVRGAPTNFLIDQKGNIVFSNFRTDGSNERTLEMMIESLLNHKS